MVRFGSSPYHLTVVIMLISALTNFQLANFPTPTYRDMISGMTVYPIRWAEWTILGGSLTFMTESLDAKYHTMPLLMAASQTASCFCGLIFPVISDRPMLWYSVMIFSCATWVLIFPRAYYTWKASKKSLTTQTQSDSFAGRLIRTAQAAIHIIGYLEFYRTQLFHELDYQQITIFRCD
jgi:MFS family permease